eukprot:5074213-Ditylum_brightwellii.AAC.1
MSKASTVQQPFVEPHHAAPPPRVPLVFNPNYYAGSPTVVPKAPFPRLHFPPQSPHGLMNHIFTAEWKKQRIDQLLAGSEQEIWSTSTANELGLLASGIPNKVKGSGT